MVFFHAFNFSLVPKIYVLDTSLKTGILWQDNDHEEIIKILNLLLYGHRKNNKKITQKCLSDLIDHAAHHFLAEEQIMFSTNYSAREITNHLREHHIFWAKVQELELKGSSDKLILEFYLWLKNHIKTYDHKLANYLLVSARLFNKTQQEKNIA